MNSAAFALLMLAAGYIAARRSLVWRPHIFRSDGHALYFLVVVTALAVVAFTASAVHEIRAIPVVGAYGQECIERLLKSFGVIAASYQLGTVATCSVPAAFALAWVLNLPLVACRSLRISILMRLSCLSELEEFLWETTAKQLPVMLTMSSSKVYVGYAIDTSVTRGERDWVRIEPLLSGYRNAEQEFIGTTDYAWLHMPSADLEQRPIDDFDILLPSDEIRSVHAFDIPSYLTKFKEIQQLEGPLPQTQLRQPREISAKTSKAQWFYIAFYAGVFLLPLTSLFLGIIGFVFFALCTAAFGYASTVDDDTAPSDETT